MQGGFSRDTGSNNKAGLGKEKAGVWFTMSIGDFLRCAATGNDTEFFKVKNTKVEKVISSLSTQVIILGRVISCVQHKSHWELVLNDTTGTISTIAYKVAASPTPSALERVEVNEGTYLKLICNYKKVDGNDKLFIEFAEQVKDFNLLSNHILVSLHAMLSLDNDVKLDAAESALNAVGANGSTPNNRQSNSNSQMIIEDRHASLTGISKFEAYLRDQFGETRKEKMSSDEIKSRLGQRFGEDQVSFFLRQLVERGDLSDSTINEKKYYELTS